MSYSIGDIPLPTKEEGFTWCIVAPRGSGKSTLTGEVLDMYVQHHIFREKNIHIFCPSIDLNDDYERFDNVKKYSKVNPSDLTQLCKEARHIKTNFGKERMPRVLVILDDCLAVSGLISNRNSALLELFVNGRHLNISVMLLSQQLNRIEKTLRINTSYWALFKPYSIKETETFLVEYVLSTEKKAFLQRFMEVWDVPYQFAFIDQVTKNNARRFRIGFDTPMFTRHEKRPRVEALDSDDEDADLPVDKKVKENDDRKLVSDPHN